MSQIGADRIYTSVDEKTSPDRAICPLCQVTVVPKGINSTRPGAEGEKHCPNCGNIFGRSGLAVKVRELVVTGASNAVTIAVDKATLQMSAEVRPDLATDKTVTWSVAPGTGTASISAGGLLKALTNGTVTVKATANDVHKAEGTLVVTLSNQSLWVSSIVVSGAGSATTIAVDNATLQMSAAVLAAGATDKAVVWSVVAGTGTASIDASGLLTALTNGTVTVKATAHDGSGVTGVLEITISNQA